jgi:hypothetical protein
VNQIVNILQQGSGGQEIGKYFLAGPVYTTNAVVAQWIQTISRGSTPVSVSFDTSTVSPTAGMGTLSTGNLSSSGFQIFSINSTGPSPNARAGGNFTIQF